MSRDVKCWGGSLSKKQSRIESCILWKTFDFPSVKNGWSNQISSYLFDNVKMVIKWPQLSPPNCKLPLNWDDFGKLLDLFMFFPQNQFSNIFPQGAQPNERHFEQLDTSQKLSLALFEDVISSLLITVILLEHLARPDLPSRMIVCSAQADYSWPHCL